MNKKSGYLSQPSQIFNMDAARYIRYVEVNFQSGQWKLKEK